MSSRSFAAGANRLLRNQIRAHLRELASGYLRTLFESHGIEISALEHSVTASRDGFALRGRIDAVQKRDGRPCLIDYKTSASRTSHTLRLDRLEDRSSWASAIPTLQLPFYVLLGRTRLEAGICGTGWLAR